MSVAGRLTAATLPQCGRDATRAGPSVVDPYPPEILGDGTSAHYALCCDTSGSELRWHFWMGGLGDPSCEKSSVAL